MTDSSAGGDGKVKVAFGTLGCKVNQAETMTLAQRFADAGYETSAPEDCDVYVLNTCTVTRTADRKSRHLLRLVQRRNPRAVVVAAGCYAGRAPGELSRVDGVDLVVGNDRKLDLPRLLEESGLVTGRGCPGSPGTFPNGGTRTRAFVKVQDGCNTPCAYCIVPLVRGSETSVPAAQVIGQVRRLVSGGYKEIVFTGVKVGTYSCERAGLQMLLEKVLSESGEARVRLSSLQPAEVSPELLGLWRDPRLCRHFHLSLQSGADSVLRRMRRRYSVGDYLNTLDMIRSAVPGAAVTTDVIVGFPGETDAEFHETYRVCEEARFARIHVFPYSPREGTEAARLSPQVPEALRRERTLKMLGLAGRSARAFQAESLGKTMTVLWEKRQGGVWSGLTDNYIRVYARSDSDLTNRLTAAKLLAVNGEGMSGAVVE